MVHPIIKAFKEEHGRVPKDAEEYAIYLNNNFNMRKKYIAASTGLSTEHVKKIIREDPKFKEESEI